MPTLEHANTASMARLHRFLGNLSNGIIFHSDFSGTMGAETALKMVGVGMHSFLATMGDQYNDMLGPNIFLNNVDPPAAWKWLVCWRACDNGKVCRWAILNSGDHCPQHVFGDVCDLVSQEVKRRLHTLKPNHRANRRALEQAFRSQKEYVWTS